ncbi:MAG: DEAD/DEAH box helicase [Thermodesulfobacteriota bacterium]
METQRRHSARQPKTRRFRPPSTGHKAPREVPPPIERRIHREARLLLREIGRPELIPFTPDPFQTEALQRVMEEDLVVSAPTGSGKTWIALEATKRLLSQRSRIWYATPLKALSNAKYQEFGEALGLENVGILTGDRKENADAPVIVGTTEILRNQLYDAMEVGTQLQTDLVILDEAHYLGDPDRGVVWEEVLIYLPGRVRLLLLSATISNAYALASWLKTIRGVPCGVVLSDERPVPLHVLFLAPDGQLTPFMHGDRLFPAAAALARIRKGKRHLLASNGTDFNELLQGLREFNLLPAIIFLKSRSDCDRAVESLIPPPKNPDLPDPSDEIDEILRTYPEFRTHTQLDALVESRAGSHHAGQLPAWRLVVERMMTMGYLDVIFSTSTVAAGVNFPARTVVLMQSDRFNGASFVDMTATDLHQMAGRAGRRGMDNIGFLLILPGKHLRLELVRDLVLSPPEPLVSRITVNFSMTLNLLLSHDPDGVRNLLGLSFSGFSQKHGRSGRIHRRLVKEFNRHLSVLQELGYVDASGIPTYDGRWAARLRLDHPLLIAELIREGAFASLTPGELAGVIAPFVMDKDRDIYLSEDLWERTRSLSRKFRRMLKLLRPLGEMLIARGFDVPGIMFWPAASSWLWSEEVDWPELIRHVKADEGDLAMLMLRTADHLRQLVALEDEQPELALTARKAIPMLMRPPLV